MTVKLRKKKLADETFSLYLDIYDKGQRVYEFLDIKLIKPKTVADRQVNKDNLELGNKIRDKKQYELNSEAHGIITTKKHTIDFIKYFEHFNDSYTKKDKRMFESSLKKFKEFVKLKFSKTAIPAKEVTENFLQNFRDYLETIHSGETPHDYFSKLKSVIKKALKDGLFITNPTDNIKNSRNAPKEKDVLSPEELNILANTELENIEVKRAFLFSCVTGLRWCDIKVLKWSSIKQNHIKIVQVKTNLVAHINLNSTALKLLSLQNKKDEFVFCLPSSTAAKGWLSKWVSSAGIEKNITWHCARHSFGTNLILYEVDILSVSKLLGHSSLTYTQRYIRAAEHLKQKAVDKLPNIHV